MIVGCDMEPRSYYYISSGKKNKLYTLRRVVTGPGFHEDGYIRSLGNKPDEAYKRAQDYISLCGRDLPLYDDGPELAAWSADGTEGNAAEFVQTQIMPFGKYAGIHVSKIPVDYKAYILSNEPRNAIGEAVHNSFKDDPAVMEYVAAREDFQKAREEQRKRSAERSQFYGAVGNRYDIEVTKIFEKWFDGYYGMNCVVIMHDDQDNVFKYFGSAPPEMEDDARYLISATVKKHEEYQGVKQTQLQRIRIIETIGVENV